jgi:hypothetical protein
MRALIISFSGKVKSKLVNNHAMEVSGYLRLSAAIQKHDWLLDTLPKGVRERHRGYWDFVYIKVNKEAKATHERLSNTPGWKPTIAMDPGVIDMIVAYDSVGHSYRFAAGGYGKLEFLNKKQDTLKSLLQNGINALCFIKRGSLIGRQEEEASCPIYTRAQVATDHDHKDMEGIGVLH